MTRLVSLTLALFVASSAVYAQEAEPEKPTYDQLMYYPHTDDLKEFEEYCRLAKDAGFTHIYVSGMNELTDYQGYADDDPWVDWAEISPSLFKHVTPKGLEDAYPKSFVKKQMKFMKEKHDIAKKLGLKSAYYGNEPMFLIEPVYRKHPKWRGTRYDNSLRTTGMFWCPNVDNAEVLEAYRSASEMLVKDCPLLDTFTFHCNDSGSGYTWSERAYVNPNGPTGSENRDMGERVVEFLGALRQGMIDGGAENPHVFQAAGKWHMPTEDKLVKRSLTPGIGLVGWLNEEDPERRKECSLGHAGGWDYDGGGTWAPTMVGIPNPGGMIGAVSNIKRGHISRFQSGGVSKQYFEVFKLLMAKPVPKTHRDKVDLYYYLAENLYDADVAEEVVQAWNTLDKARLQISMSGARFRSGLIQLRWLTRPLVTHQERLNDEEKDYWIDYIYQSKKAHPETWMDYCNLSGYRIVDNWSAAAHIAIAIDSIEATLNRAKGQLEKAAKKTTNEKAKAQLEIDALRVAALRCCWKTIRHYVQVGTLEYIRIENEQAFASIGEKMSTTNPEQPQPAKGHRGSEGLFFLHRALRWELDNTYELIDILEKAGDRKIFRTATSAEAANTLHLEPEIKENLQKKVNIMLDHWRSAEDGWYRPTKGG